MPTFEQSIEINATPADLFRLTQDYNHRLDWDPFLKEARLVGDALAAGIGARAWCVARSGLGMETEYVSFNPPKTVAVKMTKGPAIIGSFAGSWRFQELSSGRTQVIFRYHLAAAPRWLGFALDPIMRLVFTHDVTKRLAALKHTVETTDLLRRMAAETRSALWSQSAEG
ncbi:MAG: SRPBCC family protein [Roseiflexaceae bacterium]